MAMRPSEGGTLRWPGRGGNRGGGRVSEWLVAVFCLGVVLFSPLLIRIFDRGIHIDVLGVPLLFLYLFSAWAVLVGLIAWAMEHQSQGDPPSQRAAEAERTLSKREGHER